MNRMRRSCGSGLADNSPAMNSGMSSTMEKKLSQDAQRNPPFASTSGDLQFGQA
jgi:hypothetical protein